MLKKCFSVIVEDGTEDRFDKLRIDKAEHIGHRLDIDMVFRVDDGLVEQGQRVAKASRTAARKDLQSGVLIGDILELQNMPKMMHDVDDRDTFEPKMLGTAQYRRGQFERVGRRQNKLDVGRRLFQGLEQRVERLFCQHMDFVYDEDLVLTGCRPVFGMLYQVADIIDLPA